jgi:hypothetical protein
MVLKKPIKLDNITHHNLLNNEKKMLFNNGRFFIFNGVKIEKRVREVKKRVWFKTISEVVEEDFLTEINLYTWNSEYEYWGTLDDNAVFNFLFYYDIKKLRHSYEKSVKLAIEKLGFDIVKKDINHDK